MYVTLHHSRNDTGCGDLCQGLLKDVNDLKRVSVDNGVSDSVIARVKALEVRMDLSEASGRKKLSGTEDMETSGKQLIEGWIVAYNISHVYINLE